MGDIARGRVEHNGGAPQRAAERSPGLAVVALAVVAFVVCVVNFAMGSAGAGVDAAIVGLLGFGAGLAWLAMDRRKIRDAERGGSVSRPVR
jgi:hypothetical protein